MHDTFMNENGQNPLEIPGLSSPQNIAPTAIPDFESQFEQEVISKLRSSTPEEILKRKMTEYFEDLGVKPGTKRAKFASMLKEAGRGVQATPERPYVSSKDLMMQAAQTESDKLLPVLQREAATIYGQKKVEAQTASKEKIEAAKIAQAERTNKLKKDLKTADILAKQGVAGATEMKLKAQAALLEEKLRDEQNSIYSPGDTPEIKNLKALAAIQAENPDIQIDFTNLSKLKDASGYASDAKAKAMLGDIDFSKYKGRTGALAEEYKKGRFGPQPRMLGLGAPGGGIDSYVQALSRGEITPANIPQMLRGPVLSEMQRQGMSILSDPERQQLLNYKKIAPVVDSLSSLSEKINTGKGVAAKIQGGVERAKALANLNDDVAEYQAMVAAYTPLVARAVGHVGVLTQQDVDSVKKMFPAPGDSKSLRDRKIARLKQIFGGVESQTLGSITEQVKTPGKTRIPGIPDAGADAEAKEKLLEKFKLK